uniref:Uncharacterized protein n=1 Tax=Talaromyces marneffei PM1 TaxID=1077442 RepID=A0A093V4U4_TALMA
MAGGNSNKSDNAIPENEIFSCFTDTHGVITSTMNDLPGYKITKVLGTVYGLTVRSRNWGAGLGGIARSVVGGEIRVFTKLLYTARNEAVERMVGEYSIYTLKALLDAFPNELLPLFKAHSKSILNTIFWRPVRHYSDESGVVYRWMIRELELEYLFKSPVEEGEQGVGNGGAVGYGNGTTAQAAETDYRKDMWEGFRRKIRDRFIFSDGNDID